MHNTIEEEHTRGYRDGYIDGLKHGVNAPIKLLINKIDAELMPGGKRAGFLWGERGRFLCEMLGNIEEVLILCKTEIRR